MWDNDDILVKHILDTKWLKKSLSSFQAALQIVLSNKTDLDAICSAINTFQSINRHDGPTIKIAWDTPN